VDGRWRRWKQARDGGEINVQPGSVAATMHNTDFGVLWERGRRESLREEGGKVGHVGDVAEDLGCTRGDPPVLH
jgi:hypothetical protein